MPEGTDDGVEPSAQLEPLSQFAISLLTFPDDTGCDETVGPPPRQHEFVKRDRDSLDALRKVAQQLVSFEKTEPVCEGLIPAPAHSDEEDENTALTIFEARIAFLFGFLPIDTSQIDSFGSHARRYPPTTTGENLCARRDVDASTSLLSRASSIRRDVHGRYQAFVINTCLSDMGADYSLKTMAFALRLFQRYMVRYSAREVVDLCSKYGLKIGDFPSYVFSECVSLTANYLGEGPPARAMALTMHVLQALNYDVLDVTPFDYWSLIAESPLGHRGSWSTNDAVQTRLTCFSSAVVVMLSLPPFAMMRSSQLAAFAMLYSAVRGAASPQVTAQGVAEAFEARGMAQLLELWREVLPCLDKAV